jgi:hypothetical protein
MKDGSKAAGSPLTHRATFRHQGKTVTLTPTHWKGGKPMFVFRDATAGETYPACRFLIGEDADRDGEITLDFNRAFTPPCGFTDFRRLPAAAARQHPALPHRGGRTGAPDLGAMGRSGNIAHPTSPAHRPVGVAIGQRHAARAADDVAQRHPEQVPRRARRRSPRPPPRCPAGNRNMFATECSSPSDEARHRPQHRQDLVGGAAGGKAEPDRQADQRVAQGAAHQAPRPAPGPPWPSRPLPPLRPSARPEGPTGRRPPPARPRPPGCRHRRSPSSATAPPA